jgi:hypothetical protein
MDTFKTKQTNIPWVNNKAQNKSVDLPEQLKKFTEGHVLQYTIANDNPTNGSTLKQVPYNLTLQSRFSNQSRYDNLMNNSYEDAIAFKVRILYDSPSKKDDIGVLTVFWNGGAIDSFEIDNIGKINIKDFTPSYGGRGRSRRRTKKSKRSKRRKSVRRRR